MGEEHEHGHHHGLLARLRHAVTPHSHDTAASVDSALETSDRGMRALFISLAVLGLTAAIQAVVAVASGSVALLGDTLHNVADALTALPLGPAVWLRRSTAHRPRRPPRPPTRPRVRARAPPRQPPLHLRLRPVGGPGRHRHRPAHRLL